MRKLSYIYSILALTFLAGCEKHEITEMVGKDECVEVSASIFEGSTRTQLSGKDVIWKKNDAINIFYGYTSSSKFTLKTGFESTNATFRCPGLDKTGEVISHNVSVYPFDKDAKLIVNKENGEVQSYSVETTFPTVQKFSKESFGSGSSPMMAIAEAGDLSFRNVGATLKFRLMGTTGQEKITKIVATTVTRRKLAGRATYTMAVDNGTPTVELKDDAADEIVLDCGTGVTLSNTTATDFFFSLPPMSGERKVQEKELIFHVYNDRDEYVTITKEYAFECKRSMITVIGKDDPYIFNVDDAVNTGMGNTPSVPDAPESRGEWDHLW